MPMKPIATDTHDFPSLRRDGKIYVDKTMFIHRLVSDADTKLFFMSRPRRFGKSLTVSAMKALFSARRELFKGFSAHENFAKEVLTPIAWRRRISQLEGDINEKAV